MRYRAKLIRNGEQVAITRFYPSWLECQAKLTLQVGYFHPLGQLLGDLIEPGKRCMIAPRLNGEVRIEERD